MPRTLRLLHSLCYQIAIGSSLAFLAMLPADAVLVTVNQMEYDVTLFEGSFDDHSALFQAPPTGLMPWWSDNTGSLASIFALEVYNGLGSGSSVGSGPVFAFLHDAGSGTLEGWVQSLTDPNTQDLLTPFSNAAIKYAILNPVPVPLPLPVFAVLAAYRVSRKLRKRVFLAQQSQ